MHSVVFYGDGCEKIADALAQALPNCYKRDWRYAGVPSQIDRCLLVATMRDRVAIESHPAVQGFRGKMHVLTVATYSKWASVPQNAHRNTSDYISDIVQSILEDLK